MRVLVRLLLSLGLMLGAVSLAPPVSATSSPSGTATPTTGPSTGPSTGTSSPAGSADPAPSTAAKTRSLAADPAQDAASVPKTTITDHPTKPTLHRDVSFSYRADQSGLTFQCRLSGPGRSGAHYVDCPSSPGGTSSTGTKTYSHLRANRYSYTFRVRASSVAATTRTYGAAAEFAWRVYSVESPLHFVPSVGASFNNPLGDRTAERRNLARVIKTVKSMPGYAQPDRAPGTAPCPSVHSALVPSTIRITLYSMTDGELARALRAASRRCVSVQILMNQHLTVDNDPAWRLLRGALGGFRTHRSFARRCAFGCRGRSVLHAKMYVFDSHVPAPQASSNKVNNTVMVGSSNMTSNAAGVQWNDLYAARSATLYRQYSHYFDLMKLDNGFHRNPHDYVAGRYRTTFWPVASGRTEPYLTALRSIRCSGATGGTGTNAHSTVYVNMHAWFGLRGLAIEQAVRALYDRGCYVHILYSFMTPKVYYRLTHGTGGRMTARRTIFSLDGDKYADVYSHFKNIDVSGNVAGDSSARVVWTGSNNFTSDGDHFDEVLFRITSAAAFRQYRDHFRSISQRKSSGTYASFLEPVGGGRAPAAATKTTAAAAAPTIVSPDVVRDDSGNPKALD